MAKPTTTEPTTRAETAVNQSISEKALATVKPTGSLALDAFNNGDIVIGGFVLSVGPAITRPVLHQVDNAMCVFRIDGEFRTSEDLNEKAKRTAARTGKEAKKVTDMEAARVVDVFNYLTNRDEILIANAVFESAIMEAYPGSTNDKPDYLGKSFAMSSFKDPNKRYREYAIRNIIVSADGKSAKEGDKTIDG